MSEINIKANVFQTPMECVLSSKLLNQVKLQHPNGTQMVVPHAIFPFIEKGDTVFATISLFMATPEEKVSSIILPELKI